MRFDVWLKHRSIFLSEMTLPIGVNSADTKFCEGVSFSISMSKTRWDLKKFHRYFVKQGKILPRTQWSLSGSIGEDEIAAVVSNLEAWPLSLHKFVVQGSQTDKKIFSKDLLPRRLFQGAYRRNYFHPHEKIFKWNSYFSMAVLLFRTLFKVWPNKVTAPLDRINFLPCHGLVPSHPRRL